VNRTTKFLSTEGILNFRDFGGYQVEGLGRLRRGALFRSGDHSQATEGDLQIVAGLNLTCIVDLRGATERRMAACKRPEGGGVTIIQTDHATADAVKLDARVARMMTSSVDVLAAVKGLYREFVKHEALTGLIHETFQQLAKGTFPLLIHCRAGKDRTGVLASLVHHALGVHPDEIMNDYLTSNDEIRLLTMSQESRFRERYPDLHPSGLKELCRVSADYLDAFYQDVQDSFGGVEEYLGAACGVSKSCIDAMKLKLVE
jgi:protein-tyrosine phosphatase